MPLKISNNVEIADWQIELSAIRAQGAGGQNVNKVSSAIHLRFAIKSSTLPPFYKERLLQLSDSRITADGVIIIKAQKYRTQEKNREDALQRLKALILSDRGRAESPAEPLNRPKAHLRRRMDKKTQRGQTKSPAQQKGRLLASILFFGGLGGTKSPVS